MVAQEHFPHHDAEVDDPRTDSWMRMMGRAKAAALEHQSTWEIVKADPVNVIFDRVWQETAANHALDLVEDRYAPPVAAAFRRAWSTVGSASTEDTEALARAIERLRLDLARGIERAVKDGAMIFANGAPSAEFQRSFRVPNPWAEAWAATRSGELVAAAESDMREMIRLETTVSMAEGENPLQLAQRLSTSVGLIPQHRQAVERFRKTVAEKAGPAAGRRAAADYADRLRAARAETIARTEMLSSANQGQLLAWQDRGRRGLIPATARRQFIIARDDLTCPSCRKMVGERALADFNAPFRTPLGDFMTPPIHPRCRCTSAIVYPD